MTFTKVTNTGIGSTGTVLLQNLDVIGIVTAGFGVSTVDVFTTGITTFTNATDSTSTTTGSVIVSGGVGIAGSLNVGGSVSVGGTLTYEDVTNVDSVGIITARSNILVGSGITLSPDGNVFTTGVSTFTSNVKIGVGTTGFVSITPDSSIKATFRGVNEQDIIHITTGNDADNTFANIRGDNEAGIRIRGGGSSNGGTIELAGGLRNTDPGIIKFSTATSGASVERVRINKDGEVGIGTNDPQEALHIHAGANSAILLGNTGHGYKLRANITSANDYGFLIEDEDGVDLYRATSSTGTNATDTHIWYTAGSERLRIASAGQIGIAGGNYGSDNQALTSQGSSASVEWRGVNTPAWDSYQSSTQTVSTATWTLVTNLAQVIDTDAAFASSTFTVPAGGAGTYFIYGYVTIDDIQAADIVISGITINAGSAEPANARRGSFGTSGTANSRISSNVNIMTTLAVGDEVRLSVYHNEGTSEPTEAAYTRFGGYRLSI